MALVYCATLNETAKDCGNSDSDYDLVQRCLSGNRNSFEELVIRYKKLIYSVVYNMLRNKEEADDTAQEVFIRIYRALDRYDPQYKFSTWSVKIATNLCLDILRKKKIETVPIDEVYGLSSGVSGQPEQRYIRRERKQDVARAIAELPDKYKLPVVLFHQQGMSYEEIMKVTNEPMTIIKNRLYRARLILREKLTRTGIREGC